ncbi:MAG: VWA domain-containing protein, partial [Acidobacteria bacterium]
AGTAGKPGLVAVDGRTFPLEGARLSARARGGLARSRLVQRYRNPYDEPLEVLYSMPLPADGAVLGYTIRLGDRVVTGEIEGAEAARERYEQALIEGRSTGLLEQVRDDTFVQHLGNLPPGADVSVEIDVLQPLAFARAAGGAGRGTWEYRFPTVTGVRYHGASGRVPDAERLDSDRAAGEGTPARIELELVIEDGAPEEVAPEAERHRLEVTSDPEGTRVSLAEPSRLDRDIAIRWRATGDEPRARLAIGGGLPGDEGRYALLTLTPPDAPVRAARRDLTLLIDASGSMHGVPLETAKAIARRLLRSLGPGDRFAITAFATRPHPLTRGYRRATGPEVEAACRAVDRLAAGGGTEMVEALKGALRRLRPGAQHQVVLITDGYIGFEQEAVGEVLRRLPEGCRVHVAGIGAVPNRTLGLGVSRAGRGIEVIAATPEEAGRAADRLLAATGAPLLEGIRISGSAVTAVAPDRPRDLLAGAAVLIALELRPAGGEIVIEARHPDGEVWRQSRVVPAAGDEGALATELPLGALFGRERVADLEMRLAGYGGEGGADSILDEIEATGLRHRIVSRRTSLVAVSEEPAVDPTSPRRRVRLASELPSGVSAEGVGYGSFGSALRAPQMGLFVFNEAESLYSRDSFLADEATGAEPDRRLPARVVSASERRLAVEFEVPGDRFTVPEGEVYLWLAAPEGAALHASRIDPGTSTRPGPVEPGLLVRLVFELEQGDRLDPEWLERLRSASRECPLLIEVIPAGGPDGKNGFALAIGSASPVD